MKFMSHVETIITVSSRSSAILPQSQNAKVKDVQTSWSEFLSTRQRSFVV